MRRTGTTVILMIVFCVMACMLSAVSAVGMALIGYVVLRFHIDLSSRIMSVRRASFSRLVCLSILGIVLCGLGSVCDGVSTIAVVSNASDAKDAARYLLLNCIAFIASPALLWFHITHTSTSEMRKAGRAYCRRKRSLANVSRSARTAKLPLAI